MIEKTQQEFHAKHRPDGAIQIRLRKRAFVNAIDQRLLKYSVIEIVKLHVHART